MKKSVLGIVIIALLVGTLSSTNHFAFAAKEDKPIKPEDCAALLTGIKLESFKAVLECLRQAVNQASKALDDLRERLNDAVAAIQGEASERQAADTKLQNQINSISLVPGPPGPPGPPGNGKNEVIIRTVTHQANQLGPTEVSCNDDEILTGGGYNAGVYRPTISVNKNGPSPDGKKWIVELQIGPPNYPDGSVPQYDAYALCLKQITLPPPLTPNISIPEGSSVAGCEETSSCFQPAEALVDVGSVVTWINSDTAAHTVTSGDIKGEGPDGIFDSSLIAPGKTFSHKFEEAGTFKYFCMVHPWMAGKVTVI